VGVDFDAGHRIHKGLSAPFIWERAPRYNPRNTSTSTLAAPARMSARVQASIVAP